MAFVTIILSIITFFLQFLCLIMLLDFFWFKDAFRLREIDPKRRFFRHHIYGYVMAIFLLREVTV